MNLTEYQALAMRTAKIMAHMDMLVHGAMGVGSEAGELAETTVNYAMSGGVLDRDNTVEELGDGMWFAAYAADSMGLDLAEVMKADLQPITHTPDHLPKISDFALSTLRYCAAGSEVLTIVKAHKFYGKALDEAKLTAAIATYVRSIFNLCGVLQISVESVLEANIAKLKKRYADKYSDNAAIARADKQVHLLPELSEPMDDAARAARHQTATTIILNGQTSAEVDQRIFEQATGNYVNQG